MEESGRRVTKWPTIHGVINVRGVFLWQIISKVHFRPNSSVSVRGDSYCHLSAALMFTLGFCILRAGGELEGVGEPRGVMHSWREELRIARVIKLSLQKM